MKTLKNILLSAALATSLLGATVKGSYAQSNEEVKRELVQESNNFLNTNIGPLEQIRDSLNAPLDQSIENLTNYAESVKDLSNLISSCDDEELNEIRNEVRNYIQANTHNSKEVLVDENYFVPITFNGDTLKVDQMVTNFDRLQYQKDGKWHETSLDKDVDLGNGAYLRNGQIIFGEDAPTKGFSYTLLNDSEAVRLAGVNVNRDESLNSEYVANLYGRINDLNDEANDLASALADKSEEYDSLAQTMQRAEKLLNAQSDLLEGWSVGPVGGVNISQSGVSPYFGIEANTRKNTVIGLTYRVPNSTNSSDYFVEREEVPSNRPGRKAGEWVRETTNNIDETNYGVTLSVMPQITKGFNLGPRLGFTNSSVTNSAKDRTYFLQDGLELQENQDVFEESSSNYSLNAGLESRIKLNDKFSLGAGIGYDFSNSSISGNAGVSINLNNLLYGERNK